MDHPGLEKYNLSRIVNEIDDIWNYKWPKVEHIRIESREHMIERMTAALSHIVKSNEGKTVFVIVHGHPSAFLIWRLLNPKEKTMPLPLELIKKGIYLEKAGICRLEFEDSIFIKRENVKI